MNDLRRDYFDWMYDLVCSNKKYSKGRDYHELLYFLDQIDFEYANYMDANRFDDGIELRYNFGWECDIPQPIIASELDDHKCTVLEMMIALASRCENYIMSNPGKGDRTGKWFFIMIKNLGLMDQYGESINRDYIRECIDRLLDRTYEKNGKGGLFVVNNSGRDLRTVDIWYQAMWYLSNELKGEN